MEFPKWKFHPDGRSLIVQDPAEEAELEGFHDHPDQFPKPEKPKKAK